MKKKSIMGLEFKWEVFLVYLLSILGFVFSFMKDKKVDEDVKLQYNQSGTIFIINMVIYIATSLLKNVAGISIILFPLSIIQIVIFVFVIVAIVKAFSNESYEIPVISDLSKSIWK